MIDWLTGAWQWARDMYGLKRPGTYYASVAVGVLCAMAGLRLAAVAMVQLGLPVWLARVADLANVGVFVAVVAMIGNHARNYFREIEADAERYIDASLKQQVAEAERRRRATVERLTHRRDARAVARPVEMVYFIVDRQRGAVKIGYSLHPKKRLTDIQVSNAHPLELAAVTPGGWELEQRLHQHYAPWHLTGEWFELTDELQAHIAELAASTAQ